MKRLYNFNNKIKVFLETDSIPNNLNANELYKLNNQYVVYRIDVLNDMVYIGETGDIGQRMTTHGKCGRNGDKRLYEDIRKYGECTFNILAVFKTEKEAKEYEAKMIKKYKDDFLTENFKETLPLISKEERQNLLFNKIYNVRELDVC